MTADGAVGGTSNGEWWGGNRRGSNRISREVQVVYRIDPEYPAIARMYVKEGRVQVLLHLDSLGQPIPFPVISVENFDAITGQNYDDGDVEEIRFLILSESPKGYFFAAKLLEVLPRWLFTPRIENGLPTEAYLKITYDFCLWDSCSGLKIEEMKQE